MRFPLLAALAAACLAFPVVAQTESHAMSSTRNETRMLMFTRPDFSGFAMASLTHGQPAWKPEYDGNLEKLEVDGKSVKGAVLRLGKDWWTTLITSSEFEIGGAKIAPGSYVVGLQCDKDGKFALALMDSTKAMKEGVTPFTPNWKPEILAPLTLNKGAAKEPVEKMTMTFTGDQSAVGKGTFTLAWGKHTLTAPVQLHAPKK
jgi:hypothetical protein